MWMNDLKHGKGKTIHGNNDTYEGDYMFGKKHGRGFYRFNKSGNYYNGSLVDGMANGDGTFFWAKAGNKYEGKWLNDRPGGIGVKTWSNGDKYIGNWSNGSMDGRGMMIYATGVNYSGDWKKNKRTGSHRVVFIKTNYNLYIIKFILGYVKISLPNNDTYEGFVKEGLIHGKKVVFQ